MTGVKHFDFSETGQLDYELKKNVSDKIINDNRRVIYSRCKPLNRANVFDEICKYFGVSAHAALSGNRFPVYVNCKKIYAWIMEKNTNTPQRIIGEYIGHDHSTINYYRNYCQGQLDINSSFAKHIRNCEAIINRKFYL